MTYIKFASAKVTL